MVKIKIVNKTKQTISSTEELIRQGKESFNWKVEQ